MAAALQSCHADCSPVVVAVTCPYCALPVAADQAAVERGKFLAHSDCQGEHERACTYLTKTGEMVVGDSRLNPSDAARLIEIVGKAKRRERKHQEMMKSARRNRRVNSEASMPGAQVWEQAPQPET